MAEFASRAVDYPKTGTPVNLTDLPRPPQAERPDFLSGESSTRRLNDRFYRSPKILGILFRRVLIDDDTPIRHHGDLVPTDGSKIRTCIQRAVVDDLGLPPLELQSRDLELEMRYLLEAYSDRLLDIAQTHTLSKHVDSNLSEEELVSGTIMASWADHNKRREAVISMNFQVSVQEDGYNNVSLISPTRLNSSRRQYVMNL